MLRFRSAFIVLAMVATMTSARSDEHKYIPPDGFLPDAHTAIAVAEAILTPIYGEAQVKTQRPFVATLENGFWTVTGRLRPGQTGGVALVVIDKATSQIIRVTHSR